MSSQNIGRYLAQEPSAEEALRRAKGVEHRRAFHETCHPVTKGIHGPILDFENEEIAGHPNPGKLGGAEEFSRMASHGQSSVLFPNQDKYLETCRLGRSPDYGSAEYANTLSREAAALCDKLTRSGFGRGTILCPNGQNAITTTLIGLGTEALVLSESSFFSPARFMRKVMRREPIFIPARASAADLGRVLDNTLTKFGADKITVWAEIPGSATGEMTDARSYPHEARSRGIRSVINNTWPTHVHFTPLKHGFDVEVESLTKYGWGDTSGGAIIVGNDPDLKLLQDTAKFLSNGAMPPEYCARVYNRMDSLKRRLVEHHGAAHAMMDWFAEQGDIVEKIVCPTRKGSPDYELASEIFGEGNGNGLFTIFFKPDVPYEKIDQFTKGFALIRLTEGWGTHFSSVVVLNQGERHFIEWPKGPDGQPLQALRFSAGLEYPPDIVRDLEESGKRAFGPRAIIRGAVQGIAGADPNLHSTLN